MKVRHAFKCLYRKSLRATSDKIHIKGEPFELIGTYPNMDAMSQGIERSRSWIQSQMPGYIPYLYIIRYALEYAIYINRRGVVNEITNEFLEVH